MKETVFGISDRELTPPNQRLGCLYCLFTSDSWMYSSQTDCIINKEKTQIIASENVIRIPGNFYLQHPNNEVMQAQQARVQQIYICVHTTIKDFVMSKYRILWSLVPWCEIFNSAWHHAVLHFQCFLTTSVLETKHWNHFLVGTGCLGYLRLFIASVFSYFYSIVERQHKTGDLTG